MIDNSFGPQTFVNPSVERWLTGRNEVLKNLTAEIANIKGFTKAGIHRALLTVIRQAKIYTPVHTSNLIGSYTKNVVDGLKGPEGEIINNAEYAVYVHEMPEFSMATGAYTRFRKPGSGPKFLQRAIMEKQGEVLEILRDSARNRKS